MAIINFKSKIYSFLILLLVLTGRALFKYYLAPESKVNDFYAFALGFYVMVGVATIAHWVHECYATEYNASNKKEQVMTYIKLKAAKVTLSFNAIKGFTAHINVVDCQVLVLV